MRPNSLTTTILGLTSWIALTSGYSQEIQTITRIDQSIHIDGHIDESIWDEIKPLRVLQKVPNSGDNPTQKTELRLAYDDKYLYLSGRMYDTHPDQIVRNSRKRDDFTENTEWLGFIIDSYNDRENGLAFYITPNGSKLDMAISNDSQGPTGINVSWNTYWDAAASIDDSGWYGELRVPFSSLPFEVRNGKVTMGITAWRYLARNDETDIFPPRDASTGSSFRPSLSQQFEFTSIDQKKPIHITPYVLGGSINANSYSETENRYASSHSFKKEVGVDAKIAISSNSTIDLTVNTDFAQVEVDDQQVNLGRLNLFFPEKRLFFQERSGLFEFNFGNTDRVFHSRRIGINDGRLTRIYGGIRAYGRVGTLETGLINMQTRALEGFRPENFTVLRMRKRVLNENSTIGMILTNRTDFNNKHNTIYGMDATLRIYRQNYLSLRLAQASIKPIDGSIPFQDKIKFFIELENVPNRLKSWTGFVA